MADQNTTKELKNIFGKNMRDTEFEANFKSHFNDASRPYKVYVALLTQGGTNNPTAIVLENSLGAAITWTRSSEGVYLGVSSKAIFDMNKTFTMILGNTLVGATDNETIEIGIFRNSDIDVVVFTIKEVFGPVIENDDDLLLRTPVEIRVYP